MKSTGSHPKYGLCSTVRMSSFMRFVESSQFNGALDVKVRRALVDEKAVEILGDSNMCELVPVVLFASVIWNPSALMTIVTPKIWGGRNTTNEGPSLRLTS